MIPMNLILVFLFSQLMATKEQIMDNIMKNNDTRKQFLYDFNEINGEAHCYSTQEMEKQKVGEIFESFENSSKANVNFKFSNLCSRIS